MERIKRENNLNVPNALTALRILLVPFFVWQYLRGNLITALIIFLVVQQTDLLDGMIARRFNLVTSFGKLMDPLADKLLLLSVLTCFTITGKLPLWVLIVMLSKELLLIAGSAYALKKKVVVQSQFLGKAATVLFAGMVVATLLSLSPLDTILLYAGMASSLAALVFYAVDMLRKKREGTFDGASDSSGEDAEKH
jgi:cardiolipin synthase